MAEKYSPIVQWAASDARHLRRAGFRVVEYGPGVISTLHAANERVRIDSLEKASRIYQGIMRAYASSTARKLKSRVSHCQSAITKSSGR